MYRWSQISTIRICLLVSNIVFQKVWPTMLCPVLADVTMFNFHDLFVSVLMLCCSFYDKLGVMFQYLLMDNALLIGPIV